jgi:uncharacterized RDD family membrane protein YckC
MPKPFKPESFNPDMQTPSMYRRMACWTYEGMLLFGVLVASGLVYFIAAYWLAGLAPGEMKFHPQLKLGLQLTSFGMLGLYFCWMWRRGQTLAMKTWRIQIQSVHGGPASRQTVVVRYLLCWIWFAPAIVVSALFKLPVPQVLVLLVGWVCVWAVLARFHPQGQFWHDALAGTRLLTSEPATAQV